ncbi:hypothetical protein E8E12_001182, partial [Didymella heteroderae]
MAPSRDINDPNAFVFYRYHPSLAAAVLFTILFALMTALHFCQMVRKRAWFLAPFVVGGLFESVGYIGRILSSSNQWDKISYIIQSLLLLLAPALFAASIYMILGRIIRLADGERFSLIRSSRLTKLFVSGDVLCFFLQATGGGIQATAGKHPDSDKKFAKIAGKLGECVIVGGLGCQILFFGFFVIVAVVFHLRGRRHLASLGPSISWRKHLYTLYGTSLMILIRSVFRIVEYVQGNNGYLLRHEVFLYIFDATLMILVMIAMNIFHPG